MKTTLDWGNRPLPRWFTISFGVFVCLLAGGWLLKDHIRHASVGFQTFAAVLAVALAISFVANLRARPEKDQAFWVWYVLALVLLNAALLLRI